MYLFLYTVYRILCCFKYHLSFTKEENPYLCFKYYRNDKESDKKSLYRVLKEVNHLCKYWHHFPDTYFYFCHYQKQYNDMKQMKSFLPQGSYDSFCKGGLERSPYSIVVSDKILFHELMQQYDIPVSPILFLYKNNLFFVDGIVVKDQDIDRILKECSSDKLFMKLPCSGQAKGVFLAKKTNGQYYINGSKVDSAFIKQKFCDQSVFFEKQLEQEPILKSFNPDTINTVRIVTKNYKGQIEIVSAAARFGRVGKYVDNMHAGGLGVSINIQKGCFEEYGGRRFDTTKYYSHPDSGLLFKDVKVPQWEEIKSLVYKALSYLPQYRSLGFDIVTTPQGPVILEINTGAGMDLAQVGKEYGIADFFDAELTRKIK